MCTNDSCSQHVTKYISQIYSCDHNTWKNDLKEERLFCLMASGAFSLSWPERCGWVPTSVTSQKLFRSQQTSKQSELKEPETEYNHQSHSPRWPALPARSYPLRAPCLPIQHHQLNSTYSKAHRGHFRSNYRTHSTLCYVAVQCKLKLKWRWICVLSCFSF